MNDIINYKANPLHGLSLNALLIEIVDHYGFEILFAYLNVNCFKSNPSIESSEKFLKKTDWAREKVEAFYMYEFKNLPRASAEQFELPPRDRIIPEGQVAGEPAELSLEDAERLREKRIKKAEERKRQSNSNNGYGTQCQSYSDKRENKYSQQETSSLSESSHSNSQQTVDPWARSRNKSKP